MTTEVPALVCVFCEAAATERVDPPRRTLARGADPSDPSFALTVVLPDIALCAEHAQDVRQKSRTVGWCDDEGCRSFGEIGQPSPCGQPFKKLDPSRS